MRSLGIVILPLVGSCLPEKIRSSVVLPAPFLPTKAILSFELTKKLISSKSGDPPNSTVSCSTEIMFIYFSTRLVIGMKITLIVFYGQQAAKVFR